MLIERDELAEHVRGQYLSHDRIGWSIAFEHAMRNQPVRSTFGLHLFRCLAESQRLGLCKYIRHQHVVVAAQRVQRFRKADEVAGNQARALVDQLIKRVLSVGSGFSPVDRARLVVHMCAFESYMFTVRFHR